MQLKSINDAENKLQKMSKLISDNASLEDKLAESESLRRKYMERHNAQEDRIRQLTEANRSLHENIGQLKKQLSDVKTMKSQSQKIFDDKIKKLNSEIEKLKKENDTIKKAKSTS